MGELKSWQTCSWQERRREDGRTHIKLHNGCQIRITTAYRGYSTSHTNHTHVQQEAFQMCADVDSEPVSFLCISLSDEIMILWFTPPVMFSNVFISLNYKKSFYKLMLSQYVSYSVILVWLRSPLYFAISVSQLLKPLSMTFSFCFQVLLGNHFNH